MEKYPLIRKIYLYLFSLVGLTLIIIAGVRFIDMGLKAFVFTEADKQQAIYDRMPTCGPFSPEKVQSITETPGATVDVKITQAEKESMAMWLQNYKTWQEQYKNYDPVKAARQRDASNSLAMLIVGLPLYLYHWRLARKEV